MAVHRALKDVGYAVIPGFASRAEVESLSRRAQDIAREFDIRCLPRSAADNAELSAVCQNGAVAATTPAEYLLSSARTIRCFFEAEAFSSSGMLKCPQVRAVSKIGHALHDFDDEFSSFTRSAKVADVFRSLSYSSPTPVQSMVMFKQSAFANEVSAHQDSTYIFTDPLSTLGFWVALEDAGEEAGCLQVAPKSHRSGVSYRMVLRGGGPSTRFEGLAEEPPPGSYVSLPVRAGDAVVFDGALWHRSSPNRASDTRMAYTFHSVEGWSDYDRRNWLQPGGVPFEPLYISCPSLGI